MHFSWVNIWRWFEWRHQQRLLISGFKDIGIKQLLNVECQQTIASVGMNIAIQTEIDRLRKSSSKTTSNAVSLEGKQCLVIDLWKYLLFTTVFLQLSTGPFKRTENWISQQLLRFGSIALAIHSCRDILRVNWYCLSARSTIRLKTARFCAWKRVVEKGNVDTS